MSASYIAPEYQAYFRTNDCEFCGEPFGEDTYHIRLVARHNRFKYKALCSDCAAEEQKKFSKVCN